MIPNNVNTKYPQYLTPEYLIPYNLTNILSSMVRHGLYGSSEEEMISRLVDLGLVGVGYATVKGGNLVLTKSGRMIAIEAYKSQLRLTRKFDLTTTFDEFISSILFSVENGNYGEIE